MSNRLGNQTTEIDRQVSGFYKYLVFSVHVTILLYLASF